MAAEWPQEMGQHPGCDRVSLIEREEPRLGRANQGKKMSTGVVAWPGEWKQRETRHKRKETSCRPLSSSRLITRRAKKYPAVICIYEKLSPERLFCAIRPGVQQIRLHQPRLRGFDARHRLQGQRPRPDGGEKIFFS